MSDVLDQVIQWQKDIGNDGESVDTQGIHKHFGYVLEECCEGLSDGLGTDLYAKVIEPISKKLKSGASYTPTMTHEERVASVDAFADIAVFAIAGLLRCGVDPKAALKAVADSNDSKRLPDGTFLVDKDGKIAKPTTYRSPDFSGLL